MNWFTPHSAPAVPPVELIRRAEALTAAHAAGSPSGREAAIDLMIAVLGSWGFGDGLAALAPLLGRVEPSQEEEE